MKISEIAAQLGYVITVMPNTDWDITHGYTSDLLSDVMGNAPDESILITIQGHKNTVAVASLIGMKAILLCNGRKADSSMCEAAKAESIAILETESSQFIASHAIASLLGIRT